MAARIPLTLLVAALATTLAACEQGPEDALEEAAEDVAEAREEFSEQEAEVAELSDELAERRAAVEQADAALQQARSELREAEDRLLGARERLDARSTDVALFRTVQEALLEADCLSDQAVAVEVDDQLVTLDGLVDTPEQRDCAVDVAEQTPGVERVRSRVTVAR